MTPAESVIVCEGYHDRAFLSELLTREYGCKSLRNVTYPPRGRPLSGGGQYGFSVAVGKDTRYIRMIPASSDAQVLEVAHIEAGLAGTGAIERLTLVLDGDRDVAAREKSVADFAGSVGATKEASSDAFVLSTGIVPTTIRGIVWRAPDALNAELPDQQTLERLVCSSIRAAHPARATAVSGWIAGRPNPPVPEKLPKTHAAFHIAGWFSDAGSEGFFKAIWGDDAVKAELLARLEQIGASRVLDAMLR